MKSGAVFGQLRLFVFNCLSLLFMESLLALLPKSSVSSSVVVPWKHRDTQRLDAVITDLPKQPNLRCVVLPP